MALRCSGNQVSLVYASPTTGWRLVTTSTGPAVLQLSFLRNETKTQVHVECENGVAKPEIETDN